ncbi:MAG: DUF2877 domain-containing protein [Gammaproteobacteria bacterium]|nr:DUF2877 domain-containing protein [Gammaproteobacteria bacterium]
MTSLHALSTGSRMATGHFTGSVHSVFGRACNITLDGGGMLTLLAAEFGNVPHGARLDTPPGFAFDRVLCTGDRVGCRGGVARFAKAGLEVCLSGARRWHAELDQLAVDLGLPRVAAAWQLTQLVMELNARDHAQGGLNLPHARRKALPDAVGALRSHASRTAVVRLVGCGPGLTPAGDDLLVGFLAGLRASAGNCASRQAFLAELSATVRGAATGTNAISRAYLEHASDGAFAEPLANLARCIAEGVEARHVEAAAGMALAVGATSGTDGVRGLLSAMACWN